MNKIRMMALVLAFLVACVAAQAESGFIRLKSKYALGEKGAVAQLKQFEQDAKITIVSFTTEGGAAVFRNHGNLFTNAFIEYDPTVVPPQFKKQIRPVSHINVSVTLSLGDFRAFPQPHQWKNTFSFKNWNEAISFIERWKLFANDAFPVQQWMEYNNIQMTERFFFEYAEISVNDGNKWLYQTNCMPAKK